MGSVWINKCELAPIVTGSGETIKTSTTLLGSWLIAYGAVFLIIAAIYTPIKFYWLNIYAEFDYDSSSQAYLFPRLRKILTTIVIVLTVFSLTWIAYGGWVLFSQKGKICKHSIHNSGHHLYRATLAYWILMLIGIPPLALLFIDALEKPI